MQSDDVSDSAAEELSNADIGKQDNDGGDVGKSENVGGSQSEELVEKIVEVVIVDCANKDESRNEAVSGGTDECRVCQEETEESLIDLGCHCRGALAKAHRLCIVKWFQTRGSNKCEICLQISTNVPPPDIQTNYWIWRVEPTYINQERENSSAKFIWVALSLLLGGLVLDVLISMTFGVSALPTNIIIGVIIVLGLGTALRLTLEFLREWHVRRGPPPQVEPNPGLVYHPHPVL